MIKILFYLLLNATYLSVANDDFIAHKIQLCNLLSELELTKPSSSKEKKATHGRLQVLDSYLATILFSASKITFSANIYDEEEVITEVDIALSKLNITNTLNNIKGYSDTDIESYCSVNSKYVTKNKSGSLRKKMKLSLRKQTQQKGDLKYSQTKIEKILNTVRTYNTVNTRIKKDC